MQSIQKTLRHYSSQYIVKFITDNPVDMFNEWRKETNQGGLADRQSPTPVMGHLLSLYLEKGLFTQKEGIDYTLDQFKNWHLLTNSKFKMAYAARIGRNFYPSFMNQIHVLSFFSELGCFDQWCWAIHDDIVNKRDIIVKYGDKPPIAFDLYASSKVSSSAYNYKQEYRKTNSGLNYKVYPIPLDIRRNYTPGGMHWYCPKDFEQPILEYCHNSAILIGPAIPCFCGIHDKSAHKTNLNVPYANNITLDKQTKCYKPEAKVI